MRRTAEYFGKKLRNMFANNVLQWENKRLFNDNSIQPDGDRPPRLYYQYNAYDDVKIRFERGQVLSGVVFDAGDEEKIMIAYGNQRRIGRASFVEIRRQNKGSGIVGVGLPYVKCELELAEKNMTNLNLKHAETSIIHHCLMLPHIQHDKDFDQYYAIVFDDWDVASVEFEKEKMSLFHGAFDVNVSP